MRFYIGKTESTLFNCTYEQGWKDKQSAFNKHLGICSAWRDIVGLFAIDGEDVDLRSFQINSVGKDKKILKKGRQLVETGVPQINCNQRTRSSIRQRTEILQSVNPFLNDLTPEI